MNNTNLTRFNLSEEPAGESYDLLVNYAMALGGEGLLVVRDGLPLSNVGHEFIESLQPFIAQRLVSTQWPGTILFDGSAQLLYFAMTPASAGLLRRATRHLFGWQQPDLPEDLCFLAAARRPWFVSIAHEHDAYVDATESEAASMLNSAGGLAKLLRRAEPSRRPDAT